MGNHDLWRNSEVNCIQSGWAWQLSRSLLLFIGCHHLLDFSNSFPRIQPLEKRRRASIWNIKWNWTKSPMTLGETPAVAGARSKPRDCRPRPLTPRGWLGRRGPRPHSWDGRCLCRSRSHWTPASEVPCGWSEPRKSSSSCAHTVRSRQVSLKASYDTIIIKSPPPKTSIYKPSEWRGRKDPVTPSWAPWVKWRRPWDELQPGPRLVQLPCRRHRNEGQWAPASRDSEGQPSAWWSQTLIRGERRAPQLTRTTLDCETEACRKKEIFRKKEREREVSLQKTGPWKLMDHKCIPLNWSFKRKFPGLSLHNMRTAFILNPYHCI